MSEFMLIDQYGRELYRPVVVADNFFSRFKGFMFTPSGTETALLISPCSSVHTFWMRFNLDILFMDEKGRVIRTIENVPPRKIYSCNGAVKILECATGLLPIGKLDVFCLKLAKIT